jgi:hypothetical protein
MSFLWYTLTIQVNILPEHITFVIPKSFTTSNYIIKSVGIRILFFTA